MRKLASLSFAAFAAFVAIPATAADLPEDPYIPPVDYDLGGSFYLRGSAALNVMWAKEVHHTPEYVALGGTDLVPIDALGYGYSWGVGFGYETGTGLRADFTIDQLENNGLQITKDFNNAVDVDGVYVLHMRSTIAMANLYYDFYLDDLGAGMADFGIGSGLFAYVGAGVGASWNAIDATVVPEDTTVLFDIPYGTNVTPAASLMAGVGMDMGTWTADLGYRLLWIKELHNSPTTTPGVNYFIDNSLIHELRGTVRYRFN